MVTVRVAAIDLSSFRNNKSSVMHCHQFTALVVNHRLAFHLHFADPVLHGRGVEFLLDRVTQNNRFAAIRTKHPALSAWSQRFVHLGLVSKWFAKGIALPILARIVSQP